MVFEHLTADAINGVASVIPRTICEMLRLRKVSQAQVLTHMVKVQAIAFMVDYENISR
jgi:hypothetical protein